MEEVGEFPIHKAVFDNDLPNLSNFIRKYDIGQKDKHGNTALHLAVMLGRKECVQLLLNHDAPVKVKNGLGWTVLAEAVSYGNRPTISSLVRKFRHQNREQMEQRRPNLVSALNKIDDFYMELKWDFQSWVPLVSRILPSDVCKIYKSGANIRLDTTLVDFSDMRWERGDISFIFRGDAKPNESLTVMDNNGKVYQQVRYEESELEIEDEVDLLMSTDILAAQISTKRISFTRAQSGWIFREDRKELVAGQYDAELYTVHGLTLESRKRREHLSNDDLQKNKAIFDSFTKGGNIVNNDNMMAIRRASLTPPPEKNISWEEYINAEPNNYPRLGRELVYKESSKSFKATIAMSSDFPLSVEMLLNVLEVIAPFKHFSKLRDFINFKLPAGFPVKIELPILPTVTAKITFQEFEFRDNISPDMFAIPDSYIEDPTRFPDL
ncbi:ankyrin repeat domain-containing protein 13C [Anthonomus grandis grandis]|uniref:ankyrin repeat domain-containing protein 13C n=1 Tax=Anthonomus grandis grandis TaxID=2921223 RepID=UPI00216610F8|nr:ankyrin repeat domain-containing protein 13C [Anthonomus grandis grandis]XP_050311714.1 ankyrin repeat domain-containing protein 13C [Anthonomus grandis grandis]